MNQFPRLTAHSDSHLTANALTVIGIRNTRTDLDAGCELIESLSEDELRETLAALAMQAASHCVRSFGGDQAKALDVMQRMGVRLVGLPKPPAE